MKEKKFIEETRTRSMIIHENFFELLSARKINSADYATDNHEDKSTLSRWKNNKGNMTIDQVYTAAKYLNVTVNDLFYSKEEKKNIAPGFAESPYIPIQAQRPVKTRLLNDAFNNPMRFIFATLATGFIIGIIALLLISSVSELWGFLVYLVVPAALAGANELTKREDTYIINYLDDIYYTTSKTSNKSYWKIVISYSIQVLLCIAIIVGLSFAHPTLEEGDDLVAITMIVVVIQLISCLVGLSYNKKKFKQDIYYYEIIGYYIFIGIFAISVTLFYLIIMLQFTSFSTHYLLIFPSIAVMLSNTINFLFLSKEYSNYKLVYEKHGSERRELFPK